MKSEIKSDKYCVKIIVALLFEEKLRFNELHRKMLSMGNKISKPSLEDHLKHLLERRLVVRKAEGTQNVSYKLNPRIGKTREIVERSVQIAKNMENEKKMFFSENERDQLTDITANMIKRNFDIIKSQIQYKLSKSDDDKLANTIMMNALELPSSRRLEVYLIEKCIKDEAYRQRIFDAMNKFVEDIFGKTDEVKKE
jgi:DNA-binding HxlR family transcriptional regulator